MREVRGGDLLQRAAFARGLPAEDLELQVLCHFRAIREGGADLVTNTFEWLTGRSPMTVSEWLHDHRRAFGAGKPVLELASVGEG